MPLKLVNIKTPNNEEMFQLQENVNQISYQFFWWQFFLGAPLLGGGNSASSRGNLGTKSFNWNALYKLQLLFLGTLFWAPITFESWMQL